MTREMDRLTDWVKSLPAGTVFDSVEAAHAIGCPVCGRTSLRLHRLSRYGFIELIGREGTEAYKWRVME